MDASIAGKLLVATPSLIDPNFFRTVVLMIEHDDEGALGVVLNRPLEISVADYLEEWELLVADPSVVFSGGPVQQEVALALGRGSGDVEGRSDHIAHEIYLVDLDLDPASVEVNPIRVFSGYAAWGPAQLEGEINEGAWWTVDSTDEDPFHQDSATLWSSVLRRQGGELALFATMPEDPALN